jgi:tetratricopeptide (TPR) repeat protein
MVDAARMDPRAPEPRPAALDLAANALAAGDAFRALSLMGREPGALGLALRGIAYAQLGDLELARDALERAEATSDDARLRARVRAALVEVALGQGDPARAAGAARASADELSRLGDTRNAAMQRLVLARAEVLLGRLGEARRAVADVLAAELPPDVRAVASLAEAEIATRALAASEARDALVRARRALERAPNLLLGGSSPRSTPSCPSRLPAWSAAARHGTRTSSRSRRRRAESSSWSTRVGVSRSPGAPAYRWRSGRSSSRSSSSSPAPPPDRCRATRSPPARSTRAGSTRRTAAASASRSVACASFSTTSVPSPSRRPTVTRLPPGER